MPIQKGYKSEENIGNNTRGHLSADVTTRIIVLKDCEYLPDVEGGCDDMKDLRGGIGIDTYFNVCSRNWGNSCEKKKELDEENRLKKENKLANIVK